MSFLHCICALVPGLPFCVEISRFILDLLIFFLTNKKNKVFFRISHSFSIGVILTPKDTFVKKKITYLQNDRIKPSFFI